MIASSREVVCWGAIAGGPIGAAAGSALGAALFGGGNMSYAIYSFEHLDYHVNFTHVGPSLYLTIEARDRNRFGQVIAHALVELSAQINGILKPAWKPMDAPPPQSTRGEDLADLLRKALDFKKSEEGVWVPKVGDGDTVIVDRKDASEVKVLDVAEQAFERIPKKKLLVEDKPCTCELRELMIAGCHCGAVGVSKTRR